MVMILPHTGSNAIGSWLTGCIYIVHTTFSQHDRLNGILRIRPDMERAHPPVNLYKVQQKLNSLQWSWKTHNWSKHSEDRTDRLRTLAPCFVFRLIRDFSAFTYFCTLPLPANPGIHSISLLLQSSSRSDPSLSLLLWHLSILIGPKKPAGLCQSASRKLPSVEYESNNNPFFPH